MSDFVKIGDHYLRKDIVATISEPYSPHPNGEWFFKVETKMGSKFFAPADERDKFLADMGLDKP